jgi:hypothetical protein
MGEIWILFCENMSGVSSNHVLAHSVIEFAREHVEKENTLIRGGVDLSIYREHILSMQNTFYYRYTLIQ